MDGQAQWGLRTDSIHFFGGHTDIFSIALKVIYPCPVTIKFSPLRNCELQFVKIQFEVKSISP